MVFSLARTGISCRGSWATLLCTGALVERCADNAIPPRSLWPRSWASPGTRPSHWNHLNNRKIQCTEKKPYWICCCLTIGFYDDRVKGRQFPKLIYFQCRAVCSNLTTTLCRKSTFFILSYICRSAHTHIHVQITIIYVCLGGKIKNLFTIFRKICIIYTMYVSIENVIWQFSLLNVLITKQF